VRQWHDFLNRKEQELGIETINHWLRPLKILHYDACNLYLEAKDAFQILWFEEHIRKKINDDFLNNNGKVIQVHLSLPAKGTYFAKPKKRGKGVKKEEKQVEAYRFIPDQVDSLFTFENFIPDKNNLLGYKVLKELCGSSKDDGEVDFATFNPIYIYGPSGCGKTHLLSATYHELINRGVKVVYSKSKTFIDHVIHAMRSAIVSSFRNKYRNIDVLILDDIHLFSKKSACQEEFFHTFNTLHQERKQIILSAEVCPQALNQIEPRLISRFEWGVSVPMKPIEGDCLSELLHKKSELMNFPISADISEFLINTFSGHPKVLCRALEALALRVHVRDDIPENERRSLSLPMVKGLLEDLIIQEQQKELTPSRVIEIVASHYGIPLNDVLGKSQSKDCVVPRQVAMHLCRELLGMPYTKIGEIFSRNHSTVMSSCRHVKKNVAIHSSELQHNLSQIQHTLHDLVVK
jgi:chromosomal replication initiator protein